ncbi:MAG: Carbohydrate kinase, YjeF related protein [Microgenomates group bacterium GW2011_GWB1_40_9]|nr:MAG: Carbohydrate kinase, YjeF related protein [Microgenomates group bacterium GW2011_GWC1_39_12]KKR79800.1 MAG: Carbohydrate kinase, YjeF related protein [Microgenomates group bacterium GW2011_GWB1_40_9]
MKMNLPKPNSHKGQNGKLLLIGGSELFHAASLWSLTVASRIVDLVHYASVPENNEIVQKAKEEFRNGIVIHREQIHEYIEEDDVILIGPGMERTKETEELTNTLVTQYPKKQWVIDAGALQMIHPENIPTNAILTPHHQEYARVFDASAAFDAAKKYQCIIILKGVVDIVTNGVETKEIKGGNAGMTKGGTGDVLAGLVAALACTNDPFDSAVWGSKINKAAGDELYKSVGPFFNATDLANQIPKTMKKMFYP